MKKTFILLATLFAVANVPVASAQSPNTTSNATFPSPPVQGTITVSGLKSFNAVEADGRMEIFITIDPAATPELAIELNGNDPNQLKWWDDNSVMKIRHSNTKTSKPVVVRLTCRALIDLTISGASVTIQTPWVAHITTIDLSSNAKLVASIEAFDLKITARTNSTALITGIGIYTDCFCHSNSVLDLRDYVSRSVSLVGGGRSESFVHGEERLVVTALDNAAVFYRGKPTVLRLNEVRGGHANPIGD